MSLNLEIQAFKNLAQVITIDMDVGSIGFGPVTFQEEILAKFYVNSLNLSMDLSYVAYVKEMITWSIKEMNGEKLNHFYYNQDEDISVHIILRNWVHIWPDDLIEKVKMLGFLLNSEIGEIQ